VRIVPMKTARGNPAVCAQPDLYKLPKQVHIYS